MNTFKMHTFIFFLILTVVTAVAGGSAAVGPENRSNTDFLKEPVKYMAEAYGHYHNWQLDEGISKTSNALKIITRIYENDPNYALKDPKLRLNKAYQIKSTLHTMLGMLYHRKSLSSSGGSDHKKFDSLISKLSRGDKITDKELDDIGTASEKVTSTDGKDYIVRSKEEFLKAIESDPRNPTPHYQLGSIYSAMAVIGDTEQAEKEFFIAAELSVNEGDKHSAMRAVETIRSVNPDSKYIGQIETLIAGMSVNKR